MSSLPMPFLVEGCHISSMSASRYISDRRTFLRV